MGNGERRGHGIEGQGRLEANHNFKLDQTVWDTQMCPPWCDSPGQGHWRGWVWCEAPGTVPSHPLKPSKQPEDEKLALRKKEIPKNSLEVPGAQQEEPPWPQAR